MLRIQPINPPAELEWYAADAREDTSNGDPHHIWATSAFAEDLYVAATATDGWTKFEPRRAESDGEEQNRITVKAKTMTKLCKNRLCSRCTIDLVVVTDLVKDSGSTSCRTPKDN